MTKKVFWQDPSLMELETTEERRYWKSGSKFI